MTGNDARDRRDEAIDTPSEQDLSRRLERLGAELEARRPSVTPKDQVSSASSSGPSPMGMALRASSEFMAGVIVGGGVGWGIDKGLGTSPWGLIVFLLLGFAAGIYNVMRSSGFLVAASASGAPRPDRPDR